MKRIPAIILLFSASLLRGQDNSYKYFYRVWFTDKGPESSITDPYELLSERAINRRIRAGIEFPDFRDFPVYRNYLNSIEERGLTLHCTSKWMNTALFKSPVALNTGLITGLPFVKEVRAVKYPAGKSSFADKLDFSADQYGFAPYDHPLGMINGNLLQNMGYDGKGILIAVNDGGFRYTDQVPSLEHLRQRNGIRAVRDFVSGDEFTYDHHTHGTAVLSILAGKLEGMLQGTATGADYMLFRTEDVSDEFPAEEDYWAAAAEYADSAGADIITSSLGYGLFDDPSLDYKFSDLDGNSAFITRAAAIAASKGILVFSSAGNERNKAWKKILAPSDGDSVISVAAVDRDRIISAFSSAGPSADGRIKPDLSAMGVNVPVQVSPGSVSGASGTSFSCPVLSGISACLLQAVPEAVASEIAGA
ncbi:MAG: S8 family serine peptidase, partial [Bacteroidales bacterium]|nr:S8 family serine peptidase [Bacteroidales bacterium]